MSIFQTSPTTETPRSALCGCCLPQSRPKGVGLEIRRGLIPGGGEGYAHSAKGPLSCEPLGSSPLVAQQTGHHSLPQGIWPRLNKLLHSLSHEQLPHRQRQLQGLGFRTGPFTVDLVENGSQSWTLMMQRLVLGVKNTQNRTAQRPKEKGRLAQGRELSTPLASRSFSPFYGPSGLPPFPMLWVISVVIYPFLLFILLLPLSVIHAYT